MTMPSSEDSGTRDHQAIGGGQTDALADHVTVVEECCSD